MKTFPTRALSLLICMYAWMYATAQRSFCCSTKLEFVSKHFPRPFQLFTNTIPPPPPPISGSHSSSLVHSHLLSLLCTFLVVRFIYGYQCTFLQSIKWRSTNKTTHAFGVISHPACIYFSFLLLFSLHTHTHCSLYTRKSNCESI